MSLGSLGVINHVFGDVYFYLDFQALLAYAKLLLVSSLVTPFLGLVTPLLGLVTRLPLNFSYTAIALYCGKICKDIKIHPQKPPNINFVTNYPLPKFSRGSKALLVTIGYRGPVTTVTLHKAARSGQ